MRRAPTQELTDDELFHIIQNGIRFTGMPGWAGEHTPEETWQLVSFIRHLPRLTPEELDQLEKPAGPKQEGEGHEHQGGDEAR